jgi:hypothetical protein
MSSNAPAGSDYDPYCPWNSSYIDDDAEELLEPQACVDCAKDAHPESEDAERCAKCELVCWQGVFDMYKEEPGEPNPYETEIAKWERLAR